MSDRQFRIDSSGGAVRKLIMVEDGTERVVVKQKEVPPEVWGLIMLGVRVKQRRAVQPDQPDLPSAAVTTEITGGSAQRLQQVMGRMPYAAFLPGDASTVESLVVWLEALAARLRSYAETCAAAEQELQQHRRDLDAIQRVFGTAR